MAVLCDSRFRRRLYLLADCGATRMTFLRCLAGFLLACIVGATVLVLFAITPSDLIAGNSEVLRAAGLWILLTSIQTMAIAAPFALVGLIFAEKYAVRRIAPYLIAGVVLILLYFLANLSMMLAGATEYILIANGTSGLAAGLVYWLVAGRLAGHRRKATPEQASQSNGAVSREISA